MLERVAADGEDMAQAISWSSSAATGGALDHWRELIWRTLVEVEISSADENFQASIEQDALGPSTLTRVTAGPQVIRRTRSCIARGDHEPRLDLIQLRRGEFSYQQRDKQALLKVGDCVILDRSQPYVFETNADCCCVTMSLPYSWMGRWAGDPGSLSGQHLDGMRGWGRSLAVTMLQLEVDDLPNLPLPRGILADQIAAHIVLAAESPDDSQSRNRRQLVERARAAMRDALHDPDLSPEFVAQHLGISKRYLHIIFSSTGRTFTRDLLAIRLAAARDLLIDSRFDKATVGEIAYRCGFADQGHFAKRFRAAYGLSPTETRAYARS